MSINDEDLTTTAAFPGLELHGINMSRKACRQPITAATTSIRKSTSSCVLAKLSLSQLDSSQQ
jgi:hypothetical protein